MKQIEEIEYKEIEVEVELNEEKTKKESKRKVQFSSENEEKTYDPADQPHKIRMPDNRNLYVEWSKRVDNNQNNKRAKIDKAHVKKKNE